MNISSDQRPLISVILPVRNGLPWLQEAIESIVSQSLENWELLIIDDGSTDGTYEYALSLESDQIVLLRSPGSGLVDALNFGIWKARGHYLARMDADDISHDKRFEKQVAVLEANPSVGVVYTAVKLVDESGIGTRKFTTKAVAPKHLKALLTAQLKGRSIVHPTVLMRSDIVRSVEGYRHYINAEDRDFWLRLLEVTSFASLDEPLLSYRLTSTGISRSKQQRQLASALLASACFEIQSEFGVDLYIENPAIFSALDDEAIRLAALIRGQLTNFEDIKRALQMRKILLAISKTLSLAVRKPTLLLAKGRLSLQRQAISSLYDAGIRLLTLDHHRP